MKKYVGAPHPCNYMKDMIMRFSRAVILILPVALVSAEAAMAETVRISRADCQRLVEHKARADVTYQPGVDVRGRKVVPAEGRGAPYFSKLVPEMLEFPIALNPLKGGAARFGETSLTVGTIQFDMKKRQAMLDGVPLNRGDTKNLYVECRRALRKVD